MLYCSSTPLDVTTLSRPSADSRHSSEDTLYPLVYYFRLTIGLGVVTSTGGQIGPNQPKKLLPESTHESGVPVTDYGLR